MQFDFRSTARSRLGPGRLELHLQGKLNPMRYHGEALVLSFYIDLLCLSSALRKGSTGSVSAPVRREGGTPLVRTQALGSMLGLRLLSIISFRYYFYSG
ncbi:MAG TPA: hypothetical protein VN939_08780, partial [Chthoniobacterales bacterium]|nr:hypothetical protein [Chthoniobacterales bacterium]